MNADPTDGGDRLIEMIRAVDPYPAEMGGPPGDLVTRRLQDRARESSGPERSWLKVVAMIVPVTVAIAVAAVAVMLLNHGLASNPRTRSGSGVVVRPCRSSMHVGVLPVWARAGFSDPRPRVDHVLGRRDRIAAILFGTGNDLDSPPATGHNNKILWVSRGRTRAGSRLTIQAQLMRGTERVGAAVTRTVPGGPGPSIVNLPTAGCWRLTLRWSGWTDQLDLTYLHPR